MENNEKIKKEWQQYITEEKDKKNRVLSYLYKNEEEQKFLYLVENKTPVYSFLMDSQLSLISSQKIESEFYGMESFYLVSNEKSPFALMFKISKRSMLMSGFNFKNSENPYFHFEDVFFLEDAILLREFFKEFHSKEAKKLEI